MHEKKFIRFFHIYFFGMHNYNLDYNLKKNKYFYNYKKMSNIHNL